MIGRNKQKGDTSAEGAQSWRDLAGPRRVRVNSTLSRKRRQVRWAKLLGVLLLCLLLVGATIRVVWISKQKTNEPPVLTIADPIENILFYTDGVLPESWLREMITLEAGRSMMEVDIFALKEALEGNAQVKIASVERLFPSDIRIDVTERKPVMRLLTAGADGKRRLRLVARDGMVYRGIGYSVAALRQLPYLQPYQNADGSYFPLRGIEQVVELLDWVRGAQPELFRTWQVISLQYYNGRVGLPGQVIEVRSTVVPTIVFGASTDFALQLDRLVYILDYFEKNGNPSLKRIDLSLRGSAAVQLTSGRAQLF